MMQNTLKQISNIQSGVNAHHKTISHPTIFHSILSSKLPPEEKTVTRLADEAQVLMLAGTLTTAWALELITFWLLSQPDTLRRLKAELRNAIPDPNVPASLPTLEALPYLNAVIKEGLRLTYGVSCRLTRSCPTDAVTYTDPATGMAWSIPAGTPVGMTAVQIHHLESLFPDSKRFHPERWLAPNARGLERYMLAFTAGARQCLGINLAYAELYLALAAVWRRWGSTAYRDEGDEGVMELFGTGLRDVEIESDHFLPVAQPGSKGIRVKMFS
jgi:cytochrome P450